MKAHDILGVDEDATEDEIKKAFRKKSKKAHPDTGGSAEEFHRLLGSYKEMLGEDMESPINNPAGLVSQLYEAIIGKYGENVVFVNIPQEMKSIVESKIHQHSNELVEIKKQVKLFKRLSLLCKNKSILSQINTARIVDLNKATIQINRLIEDLKGTLVYIDGIEFVPEERAEQFTFKAPVFHRSTTATWGS